ncbi:polysaccharide lyase family 7 protein [Swingsia samuiensis]|uniref:Alginate lyase 2 domain-containing protein n=1 Tax=Swingsia samuiensis TaxID=1293412 RepID=A0A4Y6UNL9_9PROT|nr:polysaccharide lyase family 7 protein [Swingsia samuiensis]QDH17655.1 hypothetical protein E3D00_08845 [Swingsia samuiensis]
MLTKSLRSLITALALATPFSAYSLDRPSSPDISNFTLQEPAQGRLKIHLVPSTQLVNGYHSPFYNQNEASGSVALRTDGMATIIRGETAPETVLRENSAWYFQQTPSSIDVALHIDQLPKYGHMVIARLMSANHPTVEIDTDGNRITATLNNGFNQSRVTIGSVLADKNIQISIHTQPSGLLNITANGTKNVFSLPSAATTQALWFEAVVSPKGRYAKSHTDVAQMTVSQLHITHDIIR